MTVKNAVKNWIRRKLTRLLRNIQKLGLKYVDENWVASRRSMVWNTKQI